MITTEGRKRVLVVDDEAGFTRLLKMNLEKTGKYQVMIENRSTKAILAAKIFHPDIILLDIVMPEMDGGDVVTELKSDPHLNGIPVVMLTALVDQQETSIDAIAMSGETPVLAKPINLDLLIQCIEEATGGKQPV